MAPNSKRKQVDWKFCKTCPGVFIFAQLGFCILSFMLSLTEPIYGGTSHGYFILVQFMGVCASFFWIVVNFCEVKSAKFLQYINWNMTGTIYSGVFFLLILIGSACMVDVANATRAHRAAGVFGFFSFLSFIIHFVWEITRLMKEKKHLMPSFTAAIIQKSQSGTATPTDSQDGEDAIPEGLTGHIRPRPQSNVYPVGDGWSAQDSMRMLDGRNSKRESENSSDNFSDSSNSNNHEYSLPVQEECHINK